MELTVDQLKQLVTEAVGAAVREADQPKAEDRPPVAAPNVNFNRPIRPSISRAILAMRDGNWDRFPVERDIFRDAAREVLGLSDEVPATNPVIPLGPIAAYRVLEAVGAKATVTPAVREWAIRAMGEGTTAAGGALVPPEFLQEAFTWAILGPIAFRNAPGVDVIPVNSNVVYFPRETAVPASAAAAEAATLTATDATFAQQSITIQKQYAYAQFSNELLADANPAFDTYIARTLTRSLARFQDKQYLEGNGTAPNVLGLGSYSGLTTGYTASANGDSYSASGAPDKLIDLVFALRSVGVEPNAWIMHPRTLQSLAKVKDSSGRYILESVGGTFGAPVVPASGSLTTNSSGAVPSPFRAMLLGYPVLLSDQIPINETQGSSSNATHIYLGDFNFARVLERQGIELATSPHVAFTTDQTAVRAIARSAIVLLAPAAFVKQGGIIP
jgi:HK97 family phage major capsid protein